MEFSELKPYTSLMLTRLSPDAGRSSIVKEILGEIEELMGFDEAEPSRTLLGRNSPIERGDLMLGSLQYEELRRPGWTTDSKTKDRINHLVIVCMRKSHVAILITDSAWYRPIAERFKGTGALSALKPIEPGVLNAAFAEGPARTLWLTGIHTRTTVKADGKVLIGEDLRDALDPLGDQTYYFTAARCVTKVCERETPVGLSPRKSRVWIGPSRSWEEFCDRVSGLLSCLEQADKKRQSDDAPIPILASPVSGVAGIRDAYDMSVIAPEVVLDEGDEELRARHERLAYETRFDITSAHGVNLVADVILAETRLGSLQVDVDMSDLNRVQCSITPKPATEQEELLQEVVDLCSNRRLLQIRYESGHTLSDGVIYSVRYRDPHFDGWVFADFTGFHRDKEKPTGADGKTYAPESIGSGKSLFCWVLNKWPNIRGEGRTRAGWLACDDGSMEIADFIHLDTSMSPPLLSIIHVKGAHGLESDRGISVSDYEVVTAQAEKNLRFLDRLLLDEGLAKGVGTRKWKLVWHDGVKQPDRKGMLSALREVGESYRRRVVILQPRLSRQVLENVRAEKTGKTLSGPQVRLLQLETMLASAADACRGFGAGFMVVADGTPARAPARSASPKKVPRRRTRER